MIQASFDLDGVIRNLTYPVFGYEPPEWDYRIQEGGLVEIVDRNPNILLTAPVTEYFAVIKAYIRQREEQTGKMTRILTLQKPTWMINTLAWMEYYFQSEPLNIIFVKTMEEKFKHLGDDILVDDYPGFTDYSKVLIVDRQYNRGVEGDRVSTPLELAEKLKG